MSVQGDACVCVCVCTVWVCTHTAGHTHTHPLHTRAVSHAVPRTPAHTAHAHAPHVTRSRGAQHGGVQSPGPPTGCGTDLPKMAAPLGRAPAVRGAGGCGGGRRQGRHGELPHGGAQRGAGGVRYGRDRGAAG